MEDYMHGYYGIQMDTLIDSYHLVEAHLAEWDANGSWECQEWYLEDEDGNTLGELDKYGDCIPFAKCSDVSGWECTATPEKLQAIAPGISEDSAAKIIDSITYGCDTDMAMAARVAELQEAKIGYEGECLIVCQKNYFDAGSKNRPKPIIDENGDEMIFDNYFYAKKYLDGLDAEIYVCDCGEADRPDYVIYKL